MGTTLTGTTPQDTYDSLIKVTDNGPLTGSLKKLTDGLGNDSSLSLSTAAASLSGTFAVSGNATFDTDTLFVDAANNRVGIGTAAPTVKLQVRVAADANIALNDDGGVSRISCFNDAVTTTLPLIIQGENIRFSPLGTERGRFTSDGLTFNGDTAAANALDDYEEGTFTPSIAFGGASVGITYFDRQGNYTKIGRQVSCTIYIAMTAVGSSTGLATITGLPFTASGANRGTATAASIRFDNITYLGTLNLLGSQSGTILTFGQTNELGVDATITNANFNGDSEMVVTVTYFAA
jgi:hypothetical protein